MTSSFPNSSEAISIVSVWRLHGPEAALFALRNVLSGLQANGRKPGMLLLELQYRLERRPGLL